MLGAFSVHLASSVQSLQLNTDVLNDCHQTIYLQLCHLLEYVLNCVWN